MTHILLVKLSSMGDLIQLLPALSDARAQRPELRFDWAADTAFAEIPRWHPAVDRVIVSAHRQWRERNSGFLRHDARAWLGELRARRYDLVIDAQGSWKSAVVTALARGPGAGLDRTGIREPGAQWLYRQRYPVPRNRHAIARWRALLAMAIGYRQPTGDPDFGLSAVSWPAPPVDLPTPMLTLVTNATWPTKHWPDSHWRELIERGLDRGYRLVLPWGSAAERQRAEHLAADRPGVLVPPRMSLTEIAGLLAASVAVVSVDTGLAHLAAALGRPALTLYGPTDPRLIAATGPAALHLQADTRDCIPCGRRECHTPGYRGPQAQCLRELTPALAWARLEQVLSPSPG